MTRDYIKEWCGEDRRTFEHRRNAARRAQDARQRVYLPRYWRDPDPELERFLAAFEPKRKAAA